MARLEHWHHGQFNWIDLMTTDPSSAKSFYGGLFGWSHEDRPTDMGSPYTVFMLTEGEVCGMGQLPEAMIREGVPPCWNSYINVDDLGPVLERVIDLGGSVFMPAMKVMDAGWMAGVADPGGGRVFLWQAGEHPGAGLVNEPGTLCWNELATRDPAESMPFFGDLFGWTFTASDNAPVPYWVIENQGRQNGGVIEINDQWPPGVPAHWSAYFAVEDADRVCARVAELGGEVCMPPQAIPGARIAVLNDPQGANFKIFEPEDPATMDS